MTADDTTDAAASSASSSADLRRTWPQRLTITGVFLAAIGCFAAGGALYAGQQIIEDRNVVRLDQSSDGDGSDGAFGSDTSGEAGAVIVGAADPDQPVETFPPAEPSAKNFLITGADNNSCIDPDSPYAAAFGDRTGFGERSDTIMMWRVNPAASQIAVLSFPRDLWVKISGRSSEQRINVAYERDRPQRLIETIEQNFGIQTDHFVQIDFCAFKTLVDAAGGVTVPFSEAVRDVNTGLFVPEPGCFTFDGDHALAYVRSRKFQVFQDDGWVTDGSSDLGRISRQQDFIRRTVDSLIAAGAFDPAVIRGLIETSDDSVLTDDNLTINKMLEFAGVLRSVNPADITTYQIESRSTTIQGNSVLIPQLGGSNMQAIINVFRGDATIASAPEQVFKGNEPQAESVTDTVSTDGDSANTESTDGESDTTDTDTDIDGSAPETTIESLPFTTLPEVETENIVYGFLPDDSISCG